MRTVRTRFEFGTEYDSDEKFSAAEFECFGRAVGSKRCKFQPVLFECFGIVLIEIVFMAVTLAHQGFAVGFF